MDGPSPSGGYAAGTGREMFKYVELGRLESLIAAAFAPLGVESVQVVDAVNRVLAEDVVSPRDVPERDISHADGFAISECDDNVFKVVSSEALGSCEAAPVETGHAVPEGAVAVVPIESARLLADGRVAVPRRFERFHEIVRRGSDISRGETLCRRGEVVTPPLARALLELGIDEVRVYRRPRVLILPVGSEFVTGVKRESSSVLVRAMCEAAGASVVVSDPVDDSAEAVRRAVGEAAGAYDVVATIGGASLGPRDFTTASLMELPGTGLLVRGVTVQPGRVSSLAAVGGKPVVLLPGLVQSTVVGTIFLLQPVIRRLQGALPRAHYPIGLYRLASDYNYRGRFASFTRLRFVRLVDSDSLEVEVIESQSPIQRTILASHGFVILERWVTGLTKGSYVTVYRAPGLYSDGARTLP